MKAVAWFSALALLGAWQAAAAPPQVDALFPPGGRIGTQFNVSVTGKLEAGSSCWTNGPGVDFIATDKSEEWLVNISAETPPGLYQVVFHHVEGAAAPRWFSVGRFCETPEVEPNDEIATGQAIGALPVCINGRLEKAGDVDGYRIALKRGQTLVAMVEAYALGSAVDVMAHVINSHGERVATFSDSRNLDPFIAYRVPADGVYTLQIAGFAHPPAANVQFAGGPAVVYRLHLTAGPVVTHFHPAVSTVDQTEVSLEGYNLGEGKRAQFGGASSTKSGDIVSMAVPDAMVPLQAVRVEGAVLMESEPNDSKETATPVEHGAVAGEIASDADDDRYAISMIKDQRLEAAVWAKSIGSLLDATLRIEAPDGSVIATVDDVEEQSDPLVQWTAASDGIYQIIVHDTLRESGGARHYVMAIREPVPSVRASFLDPKALVLEAGASVSTKIKVSRRNDHKRPLVVRFDGLPAGVVLDEVAIPEAGGEVELKLSAAADAASSGQPVTVVLIDQEDGLEVARATAALRGDQLRGTSLLDETDRLWLTVKVKP